MISGEALSPRKEADQALFWIKKGMWSPTNT